MEEILQTLQKFLLQISSAQTATDTHKAKLFIMAGSRHLLFQQIDHKNQGEIFSEHIIDFCQREGLELDNRELDGEILGRYFRNWGEGIGYEGFAEILKPRDLSAHNFDQQPQEKQNPTKIFLQLITTILHSFHNLQLLRSSLIPSYTPLVSYFQQEYSSGSYFTKDCLKLFMKDREIYSKDRFLQVAGYIFGELEEKILWDGFLGRGRQGGRAKEDMYQSYVQEEFQGLVKQVEAKYENTVEEKPKNVYKSGKSCKNIDQVLNQIEQIEKNMKDRKQKKKATQPPLTLQIQNYTVSKNDLIGKVISKRNKPQPLQQSQTDNLFQPVTLTHQQKHQQPHNHTQQQSNSSQWQKYIPGSIYKSSAQRGRQMSHSGSTTQLKKCPSQAQLKIEQIQRRAMDKYLNSRRTSYLPDDSHIPYYHIETRDGQEYAGIRIRERSREGLAANYNHIYAHGPHGVESVGTLAPWLRRQASPRHIYTRNKISRGWLYDTNGDGGYMYRAVSPRLLRY